MSGSGSRLSMALTAHSLVVAGLSAAHSLRARGLRRTLLFAVLGSGIPILGELLAVNVLKALRHHARPQAGGVPLAIAIGWYNVGYGTFAVMETIMNATGRHESSRALAPAAALAATSLDLLLDPCGLDLGLWEWSGGGPYASDVRGTNGKRGVPLLNFAGWIFLVTSVTLAYQLFKPGRSAAGDSESGRGAPAALLLPAGGGVGAEAAQAEAACLLGPLCGGVVGCAEGALFYLLGSGTKTRNRGRRLCRLEHRARRA